MRRIMIQLLFSFVLVTTSIYGGKGVVPAVAPVVPIETIDPSPWYLGAGLVWAKLSDCKLVDCSYEDVTYGAMLRGGYEFNEYFGFEARGIRTFLDEGPFGGAPLQHVGLYVKPQYPINERINAYALLGYGYTENLGNGARLDYFDSDSGFSVGLGLEYDLSDQGRGWSLFLDYQRLLIKSDVPDLDAISFGLRYDF